MDVAVIVTFTLVAGSAAGAVYVVGWPLSVIDGETVPQGDGEHITLHVTPLFDGSPVTCAVIDTLPPASTVPLPVNEEMVTEMTGGGCRDALLPPPPQPPRIAAHVATERTR
jgi:hypothetical protein